jgi:hypothetical protein
MATTDSTTGPTTNQYAGAIVFGALVFLVLVRRAFRGLVVAPS